MIAVLIAMSTLRRDGPRGGVAGEGLLARLADGLVGRVVAGVVAGRGRVGVRDGLGGRVLDALDDERDVGDEGREGADGRQDRVEEERRPGLIFRSRAQYALPGQCQCAVATAPTEALHSTPGWG